MFQSRRYEILTGRPVVAAGALVSLLALAIQLAATVRAGEATPDPAPAKTCKKCLIKGYLKARADGDVEKAMGYLHADYMFKDTASGYSADRERARRSMAWDAAVHAKVTYEPLVWEGDVVTGTFIETSDLFTLAGVEPLRFKMRYTFDGDLIREAAFEKLPGSGPSLEEALASCLQWAERRRPDALAKVQPGGKPVYSAETAADWISLLQTWRSETESAAKN